MFIINIWTSLFSFIPEEHINPVISIIVASNLFGSNGLEYEDYTAAPVTIANFT